MALEWRFWGSCAAPPSPSGAFWGGSGLIRRDLTPNLTPNSRRARGFGDSPKQSQPLLSQGWWLWGVVAAGWGNRGVSVGLWGEGVGTLSQDTPGRPRTLLAVPGHPSSARDTPDHPRTFVSGHCPSATSSVPIPGHCPLSQDIPDHSRTPLTIPGHCHPSHRTFVPGHCPSQNSTCPRTLPVPGHL